MRSDKFRLKDGTVVDARRDFLDKKKLTRFRLTDKGGAYANYVKQPGKNKTRIKVDFLEHPAEQRGMPTRQQVGSVLRVRDKILGRADKLKAPVYATPVPFGRMPEKGLRKLYARENFQPVRRNAPGKPHEELWKDKGPRGASKLRAQRWKLPGELLRLPKPR